MTMRALTDEQEQAVARRSEPLLLSAAAGSGKTSVLVERFVRAVREDGVAPGRILAITFTERAAGELRERVRARFLELDEREAARDTEAAFVGTFHGFCARLLRAHPLMVGLDPDFAILDEGLAGRLRDRAFSVALRDFVHEERPAAVDLLAAYGVDRVHGMVAAVYAQLRSQGQRMPRLPPTDGLALASASASPHSAPQDSEPGLDPVETAGPEDAKAAAVCALFDDLLAGFGRAYEQLKQARAAVDFDDLELLARELLEGRPSVRDSWSERFELLMVDEFQDTNPRQLAILRALDRDNLFTVGDELQSIYGFRHADVSLFRDRRAELSERGGSLALRSNFRSRPELLDVVNAAFAERFLDFEPLIAGREVTPLPTDEQPRAELLLTSRSGWEEHEALAARIVDGLPTAPLWRQAEARLLAQRVAELIGEGRARAGEIVVLLRAMGDLDVYERALQLCGVRTLAAVGGFWEHQQVGDLLAYLRALANPLDEEALYGALASPLAGVSLRWPRAARARRPRGQARCMGGGARGQHRRQSRPGRALRVRPQLIGGFLRAPARRARRRLAQERRPTARARDRRIRLPRARALAGVGRAPSRQRPQAATPRAPLRGIRRARPARVPRPRRTSAGSAEQRRAGRARRRRRAGRGAADDDPRRQGPRVPRRVRRRPRPRAEHTRRRPARRRRARGAAARAPRRRQAHARAPLRASCARSVATRKAQEEDRIVYVAMTRARERLILSGAVEFDRWPEWRPGAEHDLLARPRARARAARAHPGHGGAFA